MLVRANVRDLQSVDRRRLVPIVGRLGERLEVALPVAVERQNIVRVTAVLCVKALFQKVYVSPCGLDGGLESRLGRLVRQVLLGGV